MASGTRQVRSFDVFDTVLTRRVGAPTAVLDVLGARLAADKALPCSAAAFVAARRHAERDLTTRLGRHATLREIHGVVARGLNVVPERGDEWAGAEEDVERELCVAVPGAVERLAAARGEGEVVFISDTPHSEAFLCELLDAAGLLGAGDRVFASSGRPVSKAHGGLFAAVAGEVGAADYRHVGDNRRGDLQAPRLEGWRSSLDARAALDRYERLLERRSAETGGLTSWLAGASRLARLGATDVPRPVAEVAAGVLGPMLVGYALWVVGQARQRGVRRLYFVARDGAVMLDAARPVVARMAPDLDLRYLHGSRQPWIFGASATSDTILRRWVTPRRDFTARTALARVGLEPEEAFALAAHPVLDPSRADEPLDAAGRDAVAALLTTEPLVDLVRAQADETALLTLDYLRQEGLLDGTPSALVDAGWEGRTAAAFDHLVRRGGGTQVEHLVVGILPSTADPRAEDGVRMTPWLFDHQRRPGELAGFPGPNMLVEMLCAGTTGRTLGYARSATGIDPVLASPTNEPVVAWGVEAMQAVAVEVATLAAPYLPDDAVHVDARGFVVDVLRAFWTDPTEAEARAWGSFPWEEEIWPPYVPVAQRLTTRDTLARLRRGDRQIRRNNSWRAGSAVVSGQPWRAILGARAWQERHRARLDRAPRRLRLGSTRFRR